MESAAVLRSFQCTSSHSKPLLGKPGMVTIHNVAFPNQSKRPVFCGKNVTSTNRNRAVLVLCAKNSETTSTAKSSSGSNGAVLSDNQSKSLEKKIPFSATFPNGFEELLTEVCDETKIAELKVKFGAFEIHMKRKIDSPASSAHIVFQTTTLAEASKQSNASTPSPPPPPKSSAEKVSPFTNVSVEKASKLAALEASGSNGYVIVSSPTVGSFRRARTLKGKKQPPACKEGDVIQEGQLIGYLDQFGTELPVNSDVAGEILKILYSDGEAVGYGDPLIAVLPSFHGINIK